VSSGENSSAPNFASGSHYQFSIPADVEAIAVVEDQALQRVGAVGYDGDECFAIGTAFREALANAIVHGCDSDASKIVEGSVDCAADGTVCIVVRDPGKGFDPDKVPDPLHQDNLTSDHGRGVYLIRQLMDEVKYSDGGRAVQMKKFRRP
jgi:serine/threonine-protein kinase RsbW